MPTLAGSDAHLVYVVTASPGAVRVRAQQAAVVAAPPLERDLPRRLHPEPTEVVVQPDDELAELEDWIPVEELELPELEDWIPSDHADVDTLESKGRRITGFSNRSRARLMYRAATLDFTELRGIVEMATFTYHDGWPKDGDVVKGHFRAWQERYYRRWGTRAAGLWKLEFQLRGAPHLHFYFGRPTASFTAFCEWGQRAWHEITTGCENDRCDHPHARRGFWLDRQFTARTASKGKIAGYFAKHNSKGTKALQNKVPDDFVNVGRFWGYVGMTVHEQEIEVDIQTMIDVRRALSKLRKARTGRKSKVPGRLIGLWSMCGDGYNIAAQLLSREGPKSSYGEWVRRLDAPKPSVLV